MRVIIFTLLALVCCGSTASALSRGMTIKEVRKEIGKAESTMAVGSKEILLYPDGQRLEFINGGLVSVDGVQVSEANSEGPVLQPAAAATTKTLPTTAPINVDQAPALPEQPTPNFNDLVTLAEDWEDEEYEDYDDYAEFDTPQARAIALFIGFIVEMVIGLIVLKIAFNVTGFPALWRQLITLSFATSLVGLISDLVFTADGFNPVRGGLSFVILLLLIRPLTDVREWSTAITIAITERIVSIVLVWGAMMVVMILLGALLS